jgi:pimeloyl-ACP methyl ester carboxylesterase
MRTVGFLILWIVLCAFAGNPVGHWEGAMVREGASLPVSFDIERTTAGLVARFNSPTQRALGIPLRNIREEGDSLHLDLVGDTTTISFDGQIRNDRFTGGFSEGQARGTFAFQRAVRAPMPYREEAVTFRNGDVTLAGTLLIPRSARRVPAVLFLHGAGPEGRVGARFLADHLARNGIAALIYDKRGVGESTGDWRTSDFQALAGDGAAGLELLASRAEIDSSHIGIYGHSQGGMIGPLLATRSRRVSFVISGAGSAVPLYQAEVNSITNQLRAQGIEGTEMEAAQRFLPLWIAMLRSEGDWTRFEAEIARVRTERWYPMLHIPARDNWFWAFYRRIADYDASVYWQRVTVPVLLIYGERDIFVPLGPTLANVDRALNRAGNTDYTILMLPRADHAFNIRPQPGQPFEWFRLAPGVPDLLVAWIQARTRPRG